MTISTGNGLGALNALPAGEAERLLLGCCSSPAWAAAVAGGRPYESVGDLLAAADAALDTLTAGDIDAALAGHPRIGQRSADATATAEQSGVDDSSRAALAAANREYEDRFGHVYLVCATGRTGAELLAILRERLGNDPASERRVLREELGKINRLRLERLAA